MLLHWIALEALRFKAAREVSMASECSTNSRRDLGIVRLLKLRLLECSTKTCSELAIARGFSSRIESGVMLYQLCLPTFISPSRRSTLLANLYLDTLLPTA